MKWNKLLMPSLLAAMLLLGACGDNKEEKDTTDTDSSNTEEVENTDDASTEDTEE